MEQLILEEILTDALARIHHRQFNAHGPRSPLFPPIGRSLRAFEPLEELTRLCTAGSCATRRCGWIRRRNNTAVFEPRALVRLFWCFAEDDMDEAVGGEFEAVAEDVHEHPSDASFLKLEIPALRGC